MIVPCSLRPLQRALMVGLACSLVGLTSCGESRDFPATYPVRGKILVNNQPAKDCQIYLRRTTEDNVKVTPHGVTNDNGEFEVMSYHEADGAPSGEYIVTI